MKDRDIDLLKGVANDTRKRRTVREVGSDACSAGLLDKAAELNDKVEDVSLRNMDVRAQAPDVERQT